MEALFKKNSGCGEELCPTRCWFEIAGQTPGYQQAGDKLSRIGNNLPHRTKLTFLKQMK